MEQKLPKKHHYVPQFYLKGFSHDQNFLWVYDKKTNNPKELKKLTTGAIAFENNFYTYESINRTKETLEDAFSKIEAIASNIIKRITFGQEINEQDKSNLAFFLSFLWLRVPESKKSMNDMTQNLYEWISRRSISVIPNEKIREILSKNGKNITEQEIKEMKEFASDKKRCKVVFKIPQNYWIRHMLQLGMDVVPALQICDWEFCVADKPFAYITSDNPFILVPSEPVDPFYGLGLLTSGAKKIVPLNSKVCLVMHEPKKNPMITFSHVSKIYYQKINRFIFNNAKRFVFSSDEGKIEKLIKNK